jgi:cell division transport system permease protein
MLTWMVIGIALALPVGLNVALDNAQTISTSWDSPAQISVFLEADVTSLTARKLTLELATRDDIAKTVFHSREDALAEFSTLTGFSDVLASLDQNPLPHLIIVSPHADGAQNTAALLQEELQARPEVAQAVLDMEWLARLNSLMELSRRIILAVGGLLVMGVVLILGNTIRLAIENRRDEIVIVKLIGGSDAFVRRPFLYTGLWFGVGGGGISAFLVGLSLWFLERPVNNLALLYQSDFTIHGLGIMGGLNLIVLGGLLGLSGAALAVSRHLSSIQPR